MSHYREINKELVEQNQAMRKNIKLYCDEILLLKGELMEKHEAELNLRKLCYNWAVNSFLQLIQYVQPDSEILPLLKNHAPSNENSSLSSSRRRATLRPETSGGKYSDGRRRSSILTTELRRSNSVINIRKPTYNASPVRRRSNEGSSEDVDTEQQNSQYVREDTETENNVQAAENELSQTETLTEVVQKTLGNIIYEVEEKEDEDEETDLGVESVYESVEEVSFEISNERCTLKDVTNSLSSTENSLKENSHLETVRNRRRPKKTKALCYSDEDSTTDQHASSVDIEKDADIDTGLTTENAIEGEEETLQEPRRHSNSRYASETNKSIPLSQDINRMNDETGKSLTSFLTDTILTNFKDAAACSTPNSHRNSLTRAKTPPVNNALTAEMDSDVLTVITNISTRPSRKCKPTNLTEPTMKPKLRNNSETKKKPKSRSRSKTKK